MMKMKSREVGMVQVNGGDEQRPVDWEMRPGGMLVQRRNPDSDRDSVPAHSLRVRVKFGSIYHELSINSQSTFGELKKMLVGPTGLHHEDQKLVFKGKERDSKSFVDISGVKNRSKIVLIEDPISREKRFIEMKKKAKIEKAKKTISQIGLEVDRLAGQVSALESVISKGGKVREKSLINLIDSLMNQLVKLDNVSGDGDVKLQIKMQVKRIQQYVEKLDILKIENSSQKIHGNQPQKGRSNERKKAETQLSPIHEQKPRNSTLKNVVITMKWETFDSTPMFLPDSSPSKPISGAGKPEHLLFDWQLF